MMVQVHIFLMTTIDINLLDCSRLLRLKVGPTMLLLLVVLLLLRRRLELELMLSMLYMWVHRRDVMMFYVLQLQHLTLPTRQFATR